MKAYHATTVEDLAATLSSNPEVGLSAPQAQKRLEEHGPNVLSQKQETTVWRILADQFISPFTWLLLTAGALAAIFGDYVESVAVLLVLLVNVAIGFFMEWQALRSMQALRKMTRTHARVRRDGKVQEIDAIDLVPGDVLLLEAGDLVTADARVVFAKALALKEASLTGESTQVDKIDAVLPEGALLADRANMVFQGTIVTRGRGEALVVATADHTELGQISASAQQARKHATPLDKRLKKLSKKLIWLTLAVSVAILVSGLIGGRDPMLMVKTAIALAVAAIPEGLPVIATLTLARGMVLLARNQAVVKTLEAVQTLGETNIIFSDKTGTLTENDMHLEQVCTPGDSTEEFVYAIGEGGNVPDEGAVRKLIEVGVLCNDSSWELESPESAFGDPIEVALLRAASEEALKTGDIRNMCSRVAEIPFDADIKLMATAHRCDNTYSVSVKGAAEAVLVHCTQAMDEQGALRALSNPEHWLKRVDDLAAEGYRVLAFACAQRAQQPTADNLLENLVFLGLGCFIDPPRADVRPAIESCLSAGVKVVMVTGDHPETAINIAEAVGIVPEGVEAVKVHGGDLDRLVADKGRADGLIDTHVFARTSPAQKLQLVDFFQRRKHVVAMTGDGVNDAPALKKADIGIAMGQRGTEAAKEVADIILRDDAFATIARAVRQGRVIFHNIRTFVVYLLSCNLSEILVVGTASLLGIPLPLLPVQILFLNMVTDVFPALAIGLNKGEADVMKKPPRQSGEPLMPRSSWIETIAYGLAMTVAVLAIEFFALYYLKLAEVAVNNMTFYTLILVQLWSVFNLPSGKVSFVFNEITRNKYVWLAIALSLLIVVAVWLIPQSRHALSLVEMPSGSWAYIMGFSLIPIVVIQLAKRLFGWRGGQ